MKIQPAILAASRFQVHVLRSGLKGPPGHLVITKDRSPPAECRKADDDPEQAGETREKQHGDGHHRSSFASEAERLNQGCTSRCATMGLKHESMQAGPLRNGSYVWRVSTSQELSLVPTFSGALFLVANAHSTPNCTQEKLGSPTPSSTQPRRQEPDRPASAPCRCPGLLVRLSRWTLLGMMKPKNTARCPHSANPISPRRCCAWGRSARLCQSEVAPPISKPQRM